MFKRWVTISACLMTFIVLNPAGLLAQSIPSRQSSLRPTDWQAPVRAKQLDAPDPRGESSSARESRQPFLQVQYVEPLDAVAMIEGGHAHPIIRAPRIEYSGTATRHAHAGPSATTNPAPSSVVDPLPHLLNHHATQAPPAVIPDASHREVWKSPYSYGFFGASGSRQWTRHYGYRDRGKEWRLR